MQDAWPQNTMSLEKSTKSKKNKVGQQNEPATRTTPNRKRSEEKTDYRLFFLFLNVCNESLDEIMENRLQNNTNNNSTAEQSTENDDGIAQGIHQQWHDTANNKQIKNR